MLAVEHNEIFQQSLVKNCIKFYFLKKKIDFMMFKVYLTVVNI